MIVRIFENKETMNLSYDKKIIQCYCAFKTHLFGKIIVFIVFSFLSTFSVRKKYGQRKILLNYLKY